MRRPTTLTAAFVRSIRRPGIYGDGRGSRGLSLRVHPMANGRTSKTWRQRVRIRGRLTTISLGPFPEISLQAARRRAVENNGEALRGVDPRTGGCPTFEQAAERVIAERSKSWRHPDRVAGQWRQSLVDHVHPAIGSKLVKDVSSSDVKAVLGSLVASKPTVAQAVRQRISTILRWAVAEDFRTAGDPTPAAVAGLAANTRPVRHHPALPYAEVGAAIQTVRASRTHPGLMSAYEFLVLTAARTSEITNAEWPEIDLGGRVWTVPVSRSKTRRPHRVPLSDRAVALLAEARARTGDQGLVFPTASGRPMTRQVFGRLQRRLGIGGSPHGFRSSFRDWAAETGVSREVAERCLAHVVAGQTEAAYLRSDLLDQRRGVMQRWSHMCEG